MIVVGTISIEFEEKRKAIIIVTWFWYTINIYWDNNNTYRTITFRSRNLKCYNNNCDISILHHR